MTAFSNHKNSEEFENLGKGIRRLIANNVDVILVFTCAIVFYLLTVQIKSMWIDEILTIRDIRKNFMDMLLSRLNSGHGPVYFSLMWLWIRIFGENEVWLRLPAVLCGLGTAWITFILAKKHTDRFTALVLLFLVLMNAPFINLSHLVRMYTMVALLIMASGFIIMRGENSEKTRDILFLAGTSALALLTHYSAGLFLLAQLTYLLARRKPKWRLSCGIGLGFFCFLPWLIFFLLRDMPHNPLHWVQEPSFQSFFSMPAKFGINDDLTGIPYWGMYVISAFIIVVAIRGVKVLGRLGRFFLLMWAVPILGASIFTLIIQGDILQIARYFSVVIVVQASLFGVGLISPWRKIPGIHYALTVGLIVISFFLVSRYVTVEPPANWRIVAEKIKAHKNKQEQVLFMGKWDGPIRYYYKGPLLSNGFLKKWKKKNPDKDLEKYLLIQAGSRLLMINSPRFLEEMDETRGSFNERLSSIVMKNYKIRKEFWVSKVKLLHLEKSALLRGEAN